MEMTEGIREATGKRVSTGSAESPPESSWPASRILKAVALFFGFYVVLHFLWAARGLFIAGFLGVIFGIALSGVVDRLEKLHIKRGIAASLVVLVLLGALAGMIALMAPKIRDQTKELGERLPQAVATIEEWFGASKASAASPSTGGGNEPATPATTTSKSPTKEPATAQRSGSSTGKKSSSGKEAGKGESPVKQLLGRQLGGLGKFLFPFASGVMAAVGGFLLIVFMAIYIAADPRLYKKGLVHLLPHSARARAAEVLPAMANALKQWLITRLIAMVVIGLVTTGGLMLLKVKGAVALGLLAGVLEFIPYFGPIVSAIPAIAIAMSDSPQKAIYVVLLFLFIQQLEGHVVSPLLLKKRVEVPPALTLVTVGALGIVMGVPGMLIAEPLLAAGMTAVKMLYVEDVVGDEVGHKE